MTPGSRFANAVHRLAAPPEQSHGLSAYWLALHSLCQELTGYTCGPDRGRFVRESWWSARITDGSFVSLGGRAWWSGGITDHGRFVRSGPDQEQFRESAAAAP